MSDVFEQAKGTEPEAQQESPAEQSGEQQSTQTAQPNASVEYKGRKWTPDEILNKFENADGYIEQLRKENEELKQVAQKGATLEEVMSKFESQQEERPPTQNEPTKANVEEVDIERVARSAFEKFQQEQQMQTNLQASLEKLETAYGDKTVDILKQKAGELDMSLDEAKQLASTKPKAFSRMFLDVQKDNTPQSSSGNVNTQTFSQNTEKRQSLAKMKNKDLVNYASSLAQQFQKG